MRNFLFIFLTFFIIKVTGQSFVTYKDTINRFSINIPVGWKYGINKNYPELILLAQRTPLNQTDTSRDNFNINVIETPNKTLDKTFADFLKYLPEAKSFKLINTGDTTFNGMDFKWLIETHKNDNSEIQMQNYDFVTLKNGKTYILTMVTFSNSFNVVKPLFDKIANSFSLLK
jgi:hypothetical protein